MLVYEYVFEVSGNNLHLQSDQLASCTSQWVHKLFSIEWTDDDQFRP